MVPGITVDDNTININGNIVTLTLSWGEPFNNFDPIVSFTVSCSGDVTCPPSFTTTDNTTRSYTITNLIPMITYTFSVVATNSIGSGEAGVLDYTTPGEVKNTIVHEQIVYSITIYNLNNTLTYVIHIKQKIFHTNLLHVSKCMCMTGEFDNLLIVHMQRSQVATLGY